MLGALVTLIASLLGGAAPPPPAPSPTPQPEPISAPPAETPPEAPHLSPEPLAVPQEIDDPVERWRPLVEDAGLPVEWALRTMWCESRGNPNAVNRAGPYVGLMQVRWGSTDPATNLAQAASIYRAREARGQRGRGAWPECGR